VLDFIGATHVPVYRGMSRPLDRPLHTASHIHGTDGLGGADIPQSTRTVEALSAPQYLIDAARQAPGELTFIFVGPLTNLAVAVALEPELPRLVKRLNAHAEPVLPRTEFTLHDVEQARLAPEEVRGHPFERDLRPLQLEVPRELLAEESERFGFGEVRGSTTEVEGRDVRGEQVHHGDSKEDQLWKQ